jgi:hypothetical protein
MTLACSPSFQTQERAWPDPEVIFLPTFPRPPVVPREDLGVRSGKFAVAFDEQSYRNVVSRCNYERERQAASGGKLAMTERCAKILARRSK